MTKITTLARVFIAAALASAGASAFAQITLDQNKALAGGSLPGDTAGFPITISQPGSYKLTSNLVVPAMTYGITITADNVTLDLNGFSITGPVTCNGVVGSDQMCSHPNQGMFGIEAVGNNVAIQNGTITGFEGSAIVVRKSARLSQLSLRDNSSNGVYVTGAAKDYQVLVERSSFERNAVAGLRAGNNTRVYQSSAVANKFGYWLLGGLLIDSTATGNSALGAALSNGAVVRGSSFAGNLGAAVSLTAPAKSAGGNFDGSNLF